MSRCEDFPCCGHGPSPFGDNGGCPDEEGRFRCVTCYERMQRGARSAICEKCRRPHRSYSEDELGMTAQDRYDAEWGA